MLRFWAPIDSGPVLSVRSMPHMTMNPLPPQAYTKDTLLKAYHWLQQQTPSIKEMALTPDILVSLYLKASRDGDQSLERPSVQNFKTELKNLAGMMGELDRPPVAEAVAAPVRPAAPPPQQQQPLPPPPQEPVMTATSSSYTLTAPSGPAPMPMSGTLDGPSRDMLLEVKALFNLSSEAEALRLVIKLGHHKAKQVFNT